MTMIIHKEPQYFVQLACSNPLEHKWFVWIFFPCALKVLLSFISKFLYVLQHCMSLIYANIEGFN